MNTIDRAVAIARGIDPKHGIKQVDRLLSNGKLDGWLSASYEGMAQLFGSYSKASMNSPARWLIAVGVLLLLGVGSIYMLNRVSGDTIMITAVMPPGSSHDIGVLDGKEPACVDEVVEDGKWGCSFRSPGGHDVDVSLDGSRLFFTYPMGMGAVTAIFLVITEQEVHWVVRSDRQTSMEYLLHGHSPLSALGSEPEPPQLEGDAAEPVNAPE